MSVNNTLSCKECDWVIPVALIENLLSGNQVFCEKCGSQIFKDDLNLPKNTEPTMKTMTKKVLKSLKSKWNNYKETH